MKINGSRGDLLLGENYNLTCTVMGADKLNPVISYEWTGTRNEDQQLLDNKNNILLFTPFKLSHAGNYSCTVNIASDYIKDIIRVTSDIETLQVQSKSSLKNLMSIYNNLDSPSSRFCYAHE